MPGEAAIFLSTAIGRVDQKILEYLPQKNLALLINSISVDETSNAKRSVCKLRLSGHQCKKNVCF